MQVRAIALALPLALGIGCKTAQSRGPETASTQQPSSSEATAAGAARSDSPLMTPGEDIKGHAEDRTVSGTVGRVSEGEILIQSSLGAEETLQVVPQTVVTIDGREGTLAEIQEGQQVRASYSDEQDGQRTAVKIEVGEPSSSGMSPGGSDTGTGSGSEAEPPRTPDLTPQPPASTIPPAPKSDG